MPSKLVVVYDRPLTLISQDVSPLRVSDFDAEHGFASQFQLIYLAFLLLYLIYNKPLKINKYLIQKTHLYKVLRAVRARFTLKPQLIHIISGRTSSCAQNSYAQL